MTGDKSGETAYRTRHDTALPITQDPAAFFTVGYTFCLK